MSSSTTQTVSNYASLIRVSHTIFALPFGLAAIVLAIPYAHVTVEKVGLIVLCIASARTAAMGFNRLVDRDIDKKNPRTSDRELPRGTVNVGSVRILVLLSSLLFVVACARLGRLPLYLSLPTLGLALGYSYAKRFTALCHIILGAAVALAPGGAWIAVGADVTLAPWLLVIGVLCWVAGFDVLYALPDREFDTRERLKSLPVLLGVRGALWASALLHAVTVLCFAAVGVVLGRGVAYAVGVLIVAGLLVYEHLLVTPTDLSKLNRAFFDLNGYVSVAFLVCVGIDQWLR